MKKSRMRSMWITTSSALGLVIILALFYQINHNSASPAVKPAPSLLAGAASATSLSVSLFLNGEKVTAALTNDGDWKLTAPVRDTADPELLDAAISSLKGLTAEETYTVTNDDAYRQYGLAKPYMIVTLSGAEGAETVTLGGKNPTGEYRYLKKDGDPRVYLVYDYKLENLKKTPGEWRNRQLFDIPMDSVTQAAWKTPREAYQLTLTEAGQFKITPGGRTLDKLPVRSFLMDFYAIPAIRFLDLKPGENPVRTAPQVTISLGDGQARQTVNLFGLIKDGELLGSISHRGGGYFVMSAELATNLLTAQLSSLWQK